MMIFMRILPGVLKELMKHVPTVLFQTVEWSDLASEFPKISRRVLTKEGYGSLFAEQMKFLRPLEIELTTEPLKSIPVQSSHNKWAAQKWLQLFFAQLHSPHGLFLDLRTQNFAIDYPTMKWHPTGLWVKFSEDFRLGLSDVYDGFYNENPELFRKGLSRIGLLSFEWPDEDQSKLCELFKAQFGSSHDFVMGFDLDEFQKAMMMMANFLLKKKVKITKDFLYLGINLVTLYSTLEETQEKLPVKKIYLQMREQFSQK
jgi:hypothetical protein